MITSLVVGLLVGQALVLVGIFAYTKWDDRRRRREALLQMGMNRASFPLCSPSRFPVTMRRVSGDEMVTRSDWNIRNEKAYKDWIEESTQAWYRRANNCLEAMDFHKSITTGFENDHPVPAPDWMLPKAEQDKELK